MAQATPHRVLIVTIGSRGDVQPFLAYANTLIQLGHQVGFATHGMFKKFVAEEAPQVEFFPLEGDPSALLQSKVFEEAFFSDSKLKQQQILKDGMKEEIPKNIKLVWRYVQEFKPTGICSGFMNLGECLAIGQKLLIPVVGACTVPIYPSAHTLPIGVDRPPFSVKFINKALSNVLWKIQWMVMGPEVNKFRLHTLRMPEAPNLGMDAAPLLYMFSSKVVPVPDDSPPHVISTGYWILPVQQEFQPPAELAEYLESGPPPVYIGFGSMPVKDKQGLLRMFSDALRKMDMRAIYCGGWANIEGLHVPDNISVINGAPHEWLMPRCSMAFHHGGAGTTAASIRAGIPTIVCPVLIDQPFWASRIVALGIGQNDVCPLKDLNTAFIVNQLTHCSEETVRNRAATFGEQVREDNGTIKAAVYSLNYFTERAAPPELTFDYMPDNQAPMCLDCKAQFTLLKRRHHCMSCGKIFCSECVKYYDLPNYETFRYCCRACSIARNLAPFDSLPFDAPASK